MELLKPEESQFAKAFTGHLPKPLRELYVKYAKQANYLFVCGAMGVAASYIGYHLSAGFIWEPAAYIVGVAVGALNNYTFTVGSFGYLFGLSERRIREDE